MTIKLCLKASNNLINYSMKRIFTFLILLIAFKANCQTMYANGYQDGYANGFCYDKNEGCSIPIPPVPPMPKIGDDQNSYQDGYNRGFASGIAKQENSTSNKGYTTTTPQTIDFIYKLDYSTINEIAAIIKNIKGIAFENYQKKDYHTCIYLTSRCLSVSPFDKELYMLVGMSYYGLKDYKMAITNLQKAKQLDPNDTQIDGIIDTITKQSANSN